MDKPGIKVRYTFPDSSSSTMTFVTQPESDKLKFVDNEDETATNILHKDDFKSLKQNKTSIARDSEDKLGHDQVFDNTSSEKQPKAKSDFDYDCFDWQRMNSYEDGQNYMSRNNQQGIKANPVSVDAISRNEYKNPNFQRQSSKAHVVHDRAGADEQTKIRDFVRQNGGTELNKMVEIRMYDTAKVVFYDAVIVYAEQDINEVIEFVEAVKNLVFAVLKYKPLIEFYDHGTFSTSNVSVAEEILNRASVVFMYLTRNVNTDYFHLLTDEAVALSRLAMNPGHVMTGRRSTDRQWALKPVHTLPVHRRDYKIPAGLVSIRGIDWFNKDSEHTKSLIISIMKEARRIRTEAERFDVGNSFWPQRERPNVAPHFVVNDKMSETRRQKFQSGVPANNRSVLHPAAKSGVVTVKFRPSARPQPPVMYHSPGPPYIQPSSHHSSQHMYGLPDEMSRLPGTQNIHNCNAPRSTSQPRQYDDMPVNARRNNNLDSQQNRSRSLQLNQQHARTEVSERIPTNNKVTNRQFSQNEHFTPNVGRNEQRVSRSHGSGQKDRIKLDSSESDGSSSEDSDDMEETLPSSNKKSINIVGCKYIQFGNNNQVLDKPATTKRKKGNKVKTAKHKYPEEEYLPGSESSSATHEVTVNKQEHSTKVQPQIIPRSPQMPPERPLSGFNSSLTEDNLDTNSRVLFDANNLKSGKPKSHNEQKHLSMLEPNIRECGFEPIVSQKLKHFQEGVLSNTANVKLKCEEAMQEYQLTLKGKKQVDFLNDLDKSDSDDDKVLTDSTIGANIEFESSEDDNDVISEDQEFSESEKQTTSSAKHQRDSERCAAKICSSLSDNGDKPPPSSSSSSSASSASASSSASPSCILGKPSSLSSITAKPDSECPKKQHLQSTVLLPRSTTDNFFRTMINTLNIIPLTENKIACSAQNVNDDSLSEDEDLD